MAVCRSIAWHRKKSDLKTIKMMAETSQKCLRSDSKNGHNHYQTGDFIIKDIEFKLFTAGHVISTNNRRLKPSMLRF